MTGTHCLSRPDLLGEAPTGFGRGLISRASEAPRRDSVPDGHEEIDDAHHDLATGLVGLKPGVRAVGARVSAELLRQGAREIIAGIPH